MTSAPDPATGAPTPRTWMPLAIAAGIAGVVVVGAFVAAGLRSGMSEGEADAVRACEDAYAAAATGGASAPEIVAGDVYSAAEWRELHEWKAAQGLLDPADLAVSDEDARAADDAAAALAEQDRDLVTVVWWLASEEHLVCTVAVEDGAARDETAAIQAGSADASGGADR